MDKNCYVCQKDILKKYICKDCYFEILRENQQLKEKLKSHNNETLCDIKENRMSKEILDAIKRLCEIVINNPSIDSELDSLALHISHHPDVINPTSHNNG